MNKLSEILKQYGTDKSVHSYDTIYENIFDPIRDSVKNILKIGVSKGASLKAWRDYFENAQIYGIDINKNTLIENEERIKIHIGNAQTKKDLDTYILSNNAKYDIIIDDGGHKLESQLISLFYLFPAIKDGGLYVIEDIQSEDDAKHFEIFKNSKIYDLRHIKNRYDDIMIVIKK